MPTYAMSDTGASDFDSTSGGGWSDDGALIVVGGAGAVLAGFHFILVDSMPFYDWRDQIIS